MGLFLKRINFSMADECHALLKSVCALKGINMGEHIYACVREDFVKRAFEDQQVQQMVLAGTYQPGSNAYSLKEAILEANNKQAASRLSTALEN
tara:strand:- start:966 stop:1247 length:282 start_codon:yes stop_codon:yes gene_type:complete